jgi:hypothetical protein
MRHVDHLPEIHVQLVHPQAHVGAACDDLGLGVLCAGTQQFNQGFW